MIFKSFLFIAIAILAIAMILKWLVSTKIGAFIFLGSIFSGIVWLGYHFGGIWGAIGLPAVLCLYYKLNPE